MYAARATERKRRNQIQQYKVEVILYDESMTVTSENRNDTGTFTSFPHQSDNLVLGNLKSMGKIGTFYEKIG